MTSAVRVVRPMTLTDAMLISTDVPETDHAEWNSGTTYALADRVIRASQHKVYESLSNGNVNHAPESSPSQWVEVGPTNRWKMFDASNSTATAQSTTMTYTLRPVGSFNALAALSTTGLISVRVRVTHPTLGTVYDRTVSVASLPAEPGWWQWFFGTRAAPTSVVLTDLPGIVGSDLIVDFSGTTEMSVGALIFGTTRDVGAYGALQGARLGIQDYSRKEANEFGDVVLVQRPYAKRIDLQVMLPASQVDATYVFLASIRATPCLWICSGRFESLVDLAFYKDFEVLFEYEQFSQCALQLEGMT